MNVYDSIFIRNSCAITINKMVTTDSENDLEVIEIFHDLIAKKNTESVDKLDHLRHFTNPKSDMYL